ncbi:MAG TPA: hypothetical protein VF989_13895 [Polyangiaceae bacterium]|jgi:uncharacterized protein (TIGR00290 family)
MSERRRVLLSWSSGKDSAWALHVLRRTPGIDVVGLLTTVNESANRVAMHAVRAEVLNAQARAAGLPLWRAGIPERCSNEEYERVMRGVVERAKGDGITAMAFGDLFLEDVRRYREEHLRGTGIEPLFPLWGEPTGELARAMLDAGVGAFVTAVDPKQIDPSFVGRAWDPSFLAELPRGADPCGENGEFHSFVWRGPMLKAPVPVRVGETVARGGFVFADLVLDGV